eukprot:9495357-Pyramimonas_sp.AAC.1
MQAYLEAMHRARGDPLPCIESQHIYAVVSAADPKKARGVDNIEPLGVQRLPPNGINQLAQLYNFVGSTGLWPQQFCATAGAMAPKPAGERILGTPPTTPKTWSKIRATIADQWPKELG